MSFYLEPLFLFFVGFLFSAHTAIYATTILHLLVAFLLLCGMLLFKSHYTHLAITLLSAILGLFFPIYLFFLPAIAYPLFYRKQYTYSLAHLVPWLAQLLHAADILEFYWIILNLFAFYLAYRSQKLTALQVQNRKLRDTAMEHELFLKEQNKSLMENQDNQIYIATLRERNRIAREIHDNVGHMLSRSLLQVGALIAICKDDNMLPILQSQKDTLDEAMTNIRNSVHDLHDESVDLNETLAQLCREFSFCPIDYSCDLSSHMDKNIKYSFITIVKESLNNIIKHSNATSVQVCVKEHPAFYQLMIEDNGTTAKGRQFSFEAADTTGIGLTNIHDRIKALNGIVKIQTENGFRIFISVPKK